MSPRAAEVIAQTLYEHQGWRHDGAPEDETSCCAREVLAALETQGLVVLDRAAAEHMVRQRDAALNRVRALARLGSRRVYLTPLAELLEALERTKVDLDSLGPGREDGRA